MPANTVPPNDGSTETHRAATTPATLLRGPVIAGLIVVLLFFGVLGTWSAMAPIAGATVASGVVSPEGSRKTVQHLEGGIIAEILVKDGDRVEAGDRLVVLEDTQARSTFEVLQGKRQLLASKLGRLLSEQTGRDEIRFPEWLLELEAASDTEVKEILQAQRDLFEARRELHVGRKAIGHKRIDEMHEQISSLESQIKSQREQIVLLAEELEAKVKLVDRGMLPRPEYLALMRRKAELEGEMAENTGDIARTHETIGETRLQIINQGAVRLDEIVSEMAETRSELGSVEPRLSAQHDILKRTLVVAPVSGVIVQLRFHTSGGVVGPGQAILDIVPQDAQLLIDAHVRPVDIDEVRPEQEARVHFLAYSGRNLPQIKGVVRSVSADTLLDELSGESYFLARVEVAEQELEKLGAGVSISPGMPAEVMIMTRERTLLQYLVQPVIDSLRRTFRES